MPKRPSLALVLLCLLLLVGCAGGSTPSTTFVPTPTDPRPAVPLSVYLYSEPNFGGHTVYAFNASDGSQRWRHDTGAELEDVGLGTSVIYMVVEATVHAIDASNDQELWHYQAGEYVAPPIANGRAFLTITDASQQHRQVLALDANTGATLWHTEVASDLSLSGVADGLLFLTSETELMTLKETDGTPLWSQKIEGHFPEITQISAGLVYVIADLGQQNALLALSSRDGARRWRFPQGGGGPHFSPRIEVANGNVFFTTTDANGSTVMSLSASNGEVRWQKPFQHSLVDTGFMDQNSLYVSLDGTVVSLSASDGSLRWQRQLSTQPILINAAGEGVGYSETFDEGLVFFHTSDGSELWHFNPPGKLDLRVARVINGLVYVSANQTAESTGLDTFYALSAADGSVRWKYAAGSPFRVIVG